MSKERMNSDPPNNLARDKRRSSLGQGLRNTAQVVNIGIVRPLAGISTAAGVGLAAGNGLELETQEALQATGIAVVSGSFFALSFISEKVIRRRK